MTRIQQPPPQPQPQQQETVEHEHNQKQGQEEPPQKIFKYTNTNDPSGTNILQHQYDQNKIDALLKWINELGAELPCVRIAPSPLGGLGGFATAQIPPGGLIGRIPNSAIMTVHRSANSVVGRAVADTAFDQHNHNQDHNQASLHQIQINTPAAHQQDLEIYSVPSRPTEEFVLWLDMCHGRNDPTHFHHPYLAALPSNAPDVPSWDPAQRSKLQGTNLGSAADKAANELKDQYDKWMPYLQKAHPALFLSNSNKAQNHQGNTSTFQYKDLVWARGMYYSRRFTPVLLSSDEHEHILVQATPQKLQDLNNPHHSLDSNNKIHTSENEPTTPHDVKGSVGIMLPVLDLFNHAPHHQITWAGSPTHVTFFAGPSQGVSRGAEIYNNYGPKSNETLMMMYGFSFTRNVHDTYGLHLVMMVSKPNPADPINCIQEKTSLGTFQIHRRDSPIDHQFPSKLWKALNQMFEIQSEDDAEDDQDQDHDHDGNDDMHDYDQTNHTVSKTRTTPQSSNEGVQADLDDEPVEIGSEAVEMLLRTLQSRLQPFLLTKDDDTRCNDNVARYRNGQRIVLEEAIETLHKMLPQQEEQYELGEE